MRLTRKSLGAFSLNQRDIINLLPNRQKSSSLEATPQTRAHSSLDVANPRPSTFELRLVGQHSLWAHHLWNAAKVLADYFDSNSDLVRGKTVLELGAAGALPSFTAACNGAEKVSVSIEVGF
jgi:predicted nicotinamide N-methyase